jgi:DMSO/TMAO reductase YedYZ molybdopterin-dependent catalytic subunit
MSQKSALPPGQFESEEFPRFGLPKYADRFPRQLREPQIQISGDIDDGLVTAHDLTRLPRVEQLSDFHCVTTWSKRSLRWGGVRFADFFNEIVTPRARQASAITFVVLRCQDGYRTGMQLSDLMAPDVLLADQLNGAALPLEHGAPLRLVAPAHYGYKNAKHLDRIEFWRDARDYRPAGPRFIEHPRARVALEERGRGAPGWLLRYLYRPLIGPTIARCRRALDEYLKVERNRRL